MAIESTLTAKEIEELEQINLKNIKSSFVLVESNSLAKSMLAAKFLAGKIYSSVEGWRDYKVYSARNGKWKAEDAEETIKFSGVVRPIEQHVIVLKDLDYFERGFFDKMLKKLEDTSINLTFIGLVSDSSLVPKTILSRCLHIYKLGRESTLTKEGNTAEINNLLGNSSLLKEYYITVENFFDKSVSNSAAELVALFEKIKKELATDSQSEIASYSLLEHIMMSAHLKILKSKLKITEKEKMMHEVTEAITASKRGVPLSYVIYRVTELLR